MQKLCGRLVAVFETISDSSILLHEPIPIDDGSSQNGQKT